MSSETKGRKYLSPTNRLLERVQNGEKRTVKEWAVALHGSASFDNVRRVYGHVYALRKRGHMLFSIDKGGHIEDVRESEEKFNFVVNRYSSEVAEPCLVRSFEYAEKLIEEHPHLRKEAIARAKALIELASKTSSELLDITYAPHDAHPARLTK